MTHAKLLIVAASAAAALVVGLNAQGADHRDPAGRHAAWSVESPGR